MSPSTSFSSTSSTSTYPSPATSNVSLSTTATSITTPTPSSKPGPNKPGVFPAYTIDILLQDRLPLIHTTIVSDPDTYLIDPTLDTNPNSKNLGSPLSSLILGPLSRHRNIVTAFHRLVIPMYKLRFTSRKSFFTYLNAVHVLCGAETVKGIKKIYLDLDLWDEEGFAEMLDVLRALGNEVLPPVEYLSPKTITSALPGLEQLQLGFVEHGTGWQDLRGPVGSDHPDKVGGEQWKELMGVMGLMEVERVEVFGLKSKRRAREIVRKGNGVQKWMEQYGEEVVYRYFEDAFGEDGEKVGEDEVIGVRDLGRFSPLKYPRGAMLEQAPDVVLKMEGEGKRIPGPDSSFWRRFWDWD